FVSGCAHGASQTWMLRLDGLVMTCPVRMWRTEIHFAFRACSGVTGCAHGSLNPNRAASSSAASLVGASMTVRSRSPISRAYSRSVKEMPQSWFPDDEDSFVFMSAVKQISPLILCRTYAK